MISRICFLATLYDKIHSVHVLRPKLCIYCIVRIQCSVDFASTCIWGLRRHLDVEYFELAVPENLVSEAPSFFVRKKT